MRLVYESRTIGNLVGAIEHLRVAALAQDPQLLPLEDATRRRHRKLSFSQERMAFMHALSVGSAAYHVAFALRFRGEIDRPALSRALASLPAHFELLRTRFLPSADGIVPVVMERGSLPLRHIEAAPGTSMQVATEFCNAPFDLVAGDTARAALIADGPLSSILVLAFEHIVIDQWSYELLLQQLARAYSEAVSGRASREPLGSTSYFEYVRWHRSWFRSHAFQPNRDYWINKLAGAERVSFDTDRPRPTATTYLGARRQLPISEQTWQLLEAIAARDNATLAMLLFSALAVLLKNHTARDDLVIGLPVANRNHGGSLGCFGSLVNTLPVRIVIKEEQSFSQLLRVVREEFLEALEHQDMPFEVLIGQLRLERDSSLSPLFGVMLNMLNTPPAEIDFPGVAVERLELDRCGAQFDLTLTVDRLHTRSIWFEYATDLYDAATVERILSRYAALLDAVLEDPGRALERMPHRTRVEAAEIRSWSKGPPAIATGIPAHELVVHTAKRLGEQVAVQCGVRTLTYAELLRRASLLASSLHRLAPGHGGRVGLMLGRSTDLPVAILGSLMGGVTFVPLDPGLPDQRLTYIAVDAALSLILSDSDSGVIGNWVPSGVAVRSIEDLVSAGDANFTPVPRADQHPAYVLYTSGTTGHPKGVQVPGRALANFLHAMRVRPGIRGTDRLLAVTTLSFDISLLELMLPLTVGAQVIIANREQARDGHSLSGLIDAHDITLMQGTPSTWFQLLEADWKGKATMRALVGGEPLPQELARRLVPLVSKLWNMYGPTETTVWSSCTLVDDVDRGITIGTPISGTAIEVVDSQGRPAGIGVYGEIVIGGAGVASGYLNRPELTNERFQDLALDGDAARYYRTGDVGSWTSAGQLRIRGRSDRQVKLRGHRIEPGEIESSAMRIAGVQRALVTTHVGSSQDVRLALYIVPREPGTLDMADVRTQLRAWMPEYMIPQLVVEIDSIPQFANGKVDFRRLAALAPSALIESDSTPLQSQDEVILQSLWKELLGIQEIERDQNFFDLGGHSLLAMRLVTRVREELQRHCTLAQVFQNPTIASLSSVLSDAAPLTSRTLVALQAEGDGTPLFCVCGVQLYRPLIARLGLDAPVFATYVPMGETLDVIVLAREYLQTIRAQQPQGPYKLMGFSLGGVLAYEIAQQLRAAGEIVEQLIILDSDVPGKPAATPVQGVLRTLRKVMGSVASSAAAMPDYLRAIRAYTPLPYSGSALYVEATEAEHFQPGYGWKDLVRHLAVLEVKSGHLEIMSEKRASEWAPSLKSAMAKVVGTAASA